MLSLAFPSLSILQNNFIKRSTYDGKKYSSWLLLDAPNKQAKLFNVWKWQKLPKIIFGKYEPSNFQTLQKQQKNVSGA